MMVLSKLCIPYCICLNFYKWWHKYIRIPKSTNICTKKNHYVPDHEQLCTSYSLHLLPLPMLQHAALPILALHYIPSGDWGFYCYDPGLLLRSWHPQTEVGPFALRVSPFLYLLWMLVLWYLKPEIKHLFALYNNFNEIGKYLIYIRHYFSIEIKIFYYKNIPLEYYSVLA